MMMTQRVIKSIKAIGPKVVVLIDEVKKESSGGIILAESTVSSEINSATAGVIVDIGSTAFEYLEKSHRPKIGDRVCFVKYEGVGMCVKNDEYRILNDDMLYCTEELDD